MEKYLIIDFNGFFLDVGMGLKRVGRLCVFKVIFVK